MTRNARHLEILIGIILLILGVLYCYFVYWDISWRIELREKHSDIAGDLSWGKIILYYHLLAITSLLLSVGGFLLILSKKIGWYISIIYSIYSLIHWLIISITTNKEVVEYYWIGYLISIFFLLILTFMLSKPVRVKYQTNKKSFIIILISVSALIIDRYFI